MISEERARERERERKREREKERERESSERGDMAEAVDQEELDPQNGPPLPLPPVPPLFLPRAVRRSAQSDRDTPLHTACLTGSYDQALMLLLRGHDPCPTNIWRESPLHLCTSRGHLNIMMLLLDGSALVNATDHQGLTPLHQAIIHGNRDACELLLCYGASIHGGEGVKICGGERVKRFGRRERVKEGCREEGVKNDGEERVREGSGEERVKEDGGERVKEGSGEEGVKGDGGERVKQGGGDEKVKDSVARVMVEGADTTRSPLELASYVHVCHDVVNSALGKVWPLQHMCRIVIRKSLGVSRRRRLKELPLPPHLIVYLSTLPISCSEELHSNWERRRSSKSESARRRGQARRRGGGRGRGIHHIRIPPTNFS